MDLATVWKLLGSAWTNAAGVGLLLLLIYDRWKNTEIKGKDAQLAAKDEIIKTKDAQIVSLEKNRDEMLRAKDAELALLRDLSAGKLKDHLVNTREAYDLAIDQLRTQLEEEQKNKKQLVDALEQAKRQEDRRSQVLVALQQAAQRSEERIQALEQLQALQNNGMGVPNLVTDGTEDEPTPGTFSSGLSPEMAVALLVFLVIATAPKRTKETDAAWSEAVKQSLSAAEAVVAANGSGEIG